MRAGITGREKALVGLRVSTSSCTSVWRQRQVILEVVRQDEHRRTSPAAGSSVASRGVGRSAGA